MVNQPCLGLEMLAHNTGSNIDQSDFSVGLPGKKTWQQTCSEHVESSASSEPNPALKMERQEMRFTTCLFVISVLHQGCI